jgi:hypothetical protein
MALVFTTVASEIRSQANMEHREDEDLLRKLDRRGRIVLGLFSRQEPISSSDVSRVLGLSVRHSRDLLNRWVAQVWLEVGDPARKTRRYHLSAEYRRIEMTNRSVQLEMVENKMEKRI